jgi:26S proteasome regulatory subunit N10
MSMGGNQPEILTTLTTDIGKVLDGLHRTKIKGSSHFSTGINVAAVSLPRGEYVKSWQLTRPYSWR